MERFDAFIWHDAAGNIVAIGEVIEADEVGEPLVGPDNEVVQASVLRAELPSLLLTHAIDPRSGRLIKRESHSAD